MNNHLYLYALVTSIYGAPLFVSIALALPPARRDRSWKTFGCAVFKSFFGVVLPLLVFFGSAFMIPDWKGGCRFGWWDCFFRGKLALSPFVLWAVSSLYYADVWGARHGLRSWVVLGFFMGSGIAAFCLVHGIVIMQLIPTHLRLHHLHLHHIDFINCFICVPLYVTLWFGIRTVQLMRESGLRPIAYLVPWLASAPFWMGSLLWSRKIYAALPDRAPDCFVVTAALRGHEQWVGPLTPCPGQGELKKVNGQLQTFWAFEALWESRRPLSHRLFRHVYNRIGPPLARLVISPWIADAVYLTLKPAEWAARIVLIMDASCRLN